MLTRRSFTRAIPALAGVRILTEAALAQRAVVNLEGLPADMVWLNANENPAGPPRSAIEAAIATLPTAGRYHYQELRELNAALAASEGLEPGQVVPGAGSGEILNIAVNAFTAPDKPLITMQPTFEGPAETARVLGRPIVEVPLSEAHAADVRKMAAAAQQAGGGLIYICNPNNPTGAATPKSDIDWLVANLPRGAMLLVDEAYIHFGDSPDLVTALDFVRQAKDVIVARTFSKIWGMAGLRAGFGCARPDLIRRMNSLRNNAVSIVIARAVIAGLNEQKTLLPERRANLIRTRKALYQWLKEHNLPFYESQANFLMIDIGRPVQEFGAAMARQGVAPGRPFPPLDTMLRVTIGSDADMERFREVFWKTYQAA